MSAWRLEWLRMTRTPRAIALGATYLVFGLLGPVTARYAQEIFNRVESGVQVIMPAPAPKDGIANYIGQVSQTGLIVVVVITAGALAFDARRGLSTFLRTRTSTMWQLIAPRFTINAAAAVTAYTLGTATAWYETALLLGSPPAGPMVAGLLCGAVYLVFAVATATAAPLAAQHLGHRPGRLAGRLGPERLPPGARHRCRQHRPAARGRRRPDGRSGPHAGWCVRGRPMQVTRGSSGPVRGLSGGTGPRSRRARLLPARR
jgi:hypothetical protein